MEVSIRDILIRTPVAEEISSTSVEENLMALVTVSPFHKLKETTIF